MQSSDKTVMVWDPFIRVFHWSLVTAYLVAWVSAEEQAVVHENAGYFMLVLIGMRLLWGLIGTRHAQFADFLTGPRRAVDYVKSLLKGRPQRYLGHNPAGAWMIVALLASLLFTVVSGLMMQGGVSGFAAGSEAWEELHEGAANLSLFLVVIHVAGVAVSSLLHNENLVRAMLSGRKPREGSDV